MINWWLEKGIAGFRIDAIINIKKDPDFASLSPDGPDGLAACTRRLEKMEGLGEYFEDIKRHTFAKYDAMTVAEVFNMKEDELADFIGDDGHFSTMFDFSAPHTDAGGGRLVPQQEAIDKRVERHDLYLSAEDTGCGICRQYHRESR